MHKGDTSLAALVVVNDDDFDFVIHKLREADTNELFKFESYRVDSVTEAVEAIKEYNDGYKNQWAD